MFRPILPPLKVTAAPRAARARSPRLAGAIMVVAAILLVTGVIIALTGLHSAVQAAAPDAFDAKWLSAFCMGNDQCAVGDVNGDGRDDVLTFVRDASYGATPGSVLVALSTGFNFATSQKWIDAFCVGSDICKLADANGDGRDDLVVFKRGSQPQVWVALSTGTGFTAPAVWQNFFCGGQEVCEVGDFNGDGRADVATFLRSDYGGASTGDVFVALSSGSSFGASQKWHDFFCIGQEGCQVGDFNGDRKADIVSFSQSSSADVFVALSNGGAFGAGVKWHDFFCAGKEVCGVGDFNGDGADDVITFLRSDYATASPSTNGDVYVGLSDGAGGFVAGPKWSEEFCTGIEICQVGDFDGNGRKDVVRFLRDTNLSDRGAVYVSVATGNAPVFVATGAKWAHYLCVGGQECLTGDVDGDSLTDAISLVRDTISGIAQGDVIVALSNGVSFGSQQKWAEFLCTGQDVCRVADVNGDRRADIVIFKRGTQPQVLVALSTGAGFAAPAVWQNFFCGGQEVCEVGDFNGDGRADIATFLRSDYATANPLSMGDVSVALSTGSSFGAGQKWHDFFCIGQEWCQVGDFNGDGRADIATFTRGSQADVYVAFSSGSSFGTGAKWQDFFCAGSEQCATGDFDGDGRDDVITFLRSDYASANPASVGDVYVGLSNGVDSFLTGPKWNDFFCIGSEICRPGDFNGDGRRDVATFLRSTQLGDKEGDIYVALANGQRYAFSVPAAPPVPTATPTATLTPTQTATPTITPTPTATATRIPTEIAKYIYLPIVFR